MAKNKEKKPKNTDKLLTKLAIITTIVCTLVVAYFSLKNEYGNKANSYADTINAINALNTQYNATALVQNPITNDDLNSLITKCSSENVNWDIFNGNTFSAEKYDALSSVGSSLSLTDREAGRLMQGILNVTGANTYSVNFDEVTISLNSAQNRVDFKFVFSFSLKSVLSITDDLESALEEVNVKLPMFVYATNTCSINLLNNAVENAKITYNALDASSSDKVTAVLNAGKEGQQNSFETFAPRLFNAMNNEITAKTGTQAVFTQNGIDYIK